MKIVNTDLMSHPMNWVTIFVMSLVGFLVLDMAIIFWRNSVNQSSS